ncbi:hypothetical protein SAMN02800694_0427 [Luteibacter sp. UNCMF331Sha3.1]|uniref:hypothetical protein n=1 Tax=Luteibacter sp. UNCMF331Sha3.1 TaxID=1502760 RepID=UPI0008D78913|nr:hypothetical protein [Luteibacter sp. UNCMF331Sha3.1]SEM26463.1 hypothetical protein SAMN02800694_0427 [Luteibacter sp. UNCMF331Sha3.1]
MKKDMFVKGFVVATLAIAGAASASSPSAWKDYNQRLTQACVAASGLKDAKPVGGPIQYDDRVPVTALVLAGRYPQKHMNNRPGRELCVWDRKANKAYVSEADQLLPK